MTGTRNSTSGTQASMRGRVRMHEGEEVRRLLQCVSDVVYKFQIEPDFRLDYVSPSVLEVLGYRPEDFQNDPGLLRKLVHENDQQLLDAALLAPWSIGRFELRHRRTDGLLVCLEHEVTSLREGGKIVGFVGVARDVTERNQRESSLRVMAARYQLLSQNIRDVCYRIRMRPRLRFEYVSPSVVEVLGYEPEEFLADPELLRRIAHDEDRPLMDRILSSAEFIMVDWEIRLRHRNGAYVWLEGRSRSEYDDGELIARTGIARDITRHKRIEAALQAMKEQLEEQSRVRGYPRSEVSARRPAHKQPPER